MVQVILLHRLYIYNLLFLELKAESKKLLEAIQSFINFKKAMLAIIDVKHFPEMDVENLKHSRKYFHILIYFMVAFIKKIFIDF